MFFVTRKLKYWVIGPSQELQSPFLQTTLGKTTEAQNESTEGEPVQVCRTRRSMDNSEIGEVRKRNISEILL